MKNKKVTLEGKVIQTEEDFYAQLEEKVKLPRYFGRNLDALWDIATGLEISSPINPLEIVWLNSDFSKNNLGGFYDDLILLFNDLEKENVGIKLALF
ncbi:MAG: barstar family protein [Elusimicrobia bacterium]|nr:barstar family protein [Elusimicrobiota bacterium]